MTQQEQFINRISKPCQQACAGTGLFPSVMIAQACLESGYGKSLLSSKYNNLFGIKSSPDWKGKTVVMNTREFLNNVYVYLKGTFRVYASPLQSIKDRVAFIKQNPRYTKFGVFSAKTPQQQTQALEDAGYATSKKYNETLDAIIAKYSLQRFDVAPAMAGMNKWLAIVIILIVLFNFNKIRQAK